MNKHIDAKKYEYIAREFSNLSFYIGACCLDDISYDVVIVDDKCDAKAYSLYSNVPVPISKIYTIRMLNIHPNLLVEIVKMYLALFPKAFDGRLQQFVNGYHQILDS